MWTVFTAYPHCDCTLGRNSNLVFLKTLKLNKIITKCQHGIIGLEITSRLIGGRIADPGQFPHHASVQSFDRNNIVLDICSGSLIGNRWVLTAASCVQNGHVIEVGLGSNNLRNPALVVRTKVKHIHPSYGNQDVRFNIAVLEFPLTIPYSRNIRPILLDEVPCDNCDQDTILISGFGQPGIQKHIWLTKMQACKLFNIYTKAINRWIVCSTLVFA